MTHLELKKYVMDFGEGNGINSMRSRLVEPGVVEVDIEFLPGIHRHDIETTSAALEEQLRAIKPVGSKIIVKWMVAQW